MNNIKNKVVLIGAGNVGMSYCYSLINQKTEVDELVIIDINKEKVLGEVMDLNHGLSFSSNKIHIKSGDYSDCRDADLIVISAGASQKEGETRLDLINKNNIIFKNIISKVMENDFKGIFLVATNPVDIMTYITYKHSKLDHNRVIGSGTTLDTARLRYLLSEEIHVHVKNIHAYVMGEHGDSEFVPWSNTIFGIEKITNHLNKDKLSKIEYDVRNSAYDIIKKKGSTHYGIGMCLVRITNAIFGNENSILSISSYDKDNNIYYGVPTILNRLGVKNRVNLNLNNEEKNKLNLSIKVIKEAIKSIEC